MDLFSEVIDLIGPIQAHCVSAALVRHPNRVLTMSSTYPIIASRAVNPHISSSCSQCHSQVEFPVPSPVPRPATMLQIRCYKCQSIISHTFYPNQIPGGSGASGGSGNVADEQPRSSQSQPARKGRKIGTQDRPLETGYYDTLGIPVTAT